MMNKRIFFAFIFSILLLPQFAFAQTASTSGTTTSTLVGSTTEEKVRNYFADIPVMIEIARCESKFRQFADSGNVLRGGLGGTMLGVYQFSEMYHLAASKQLGFDITTLEGNLAYARHIYNKEGTSPWISSFDCWNVPSLNSNNSNSTEFKTLKLGTVSNDVLELQKLLNKAGFTVAQSGPGSVGSETTMFGALTKAALKKFQCAKSIVCSGEEYSTGFGLYTLQTRDALVYAANNTSSNTTSTGGATDIESLKAKIVELTALVAKLQAQLAEMNKNR